MTDKSKLQCPYCSYLFSKEIKRAKNCEHCKNKLYVRSTSPIFDSSLLTDKQMYASDFFVTLQEYGATEEVYHGTAELLRSKWRTEPSYFDIVWTIALNLPEKHMDTDIDGNVTQSVLQRAKMIAHAQAEYQAKLGHDPDGMLQLVAEYDIKLALDLRKGFDTEYSFIMCCSQCCDICLKHDGEEHSVEDIESLHPIPIEGCTRQYSHNPKMSWCICSYSISRK